MSNPIALKGHQHLCPMVTGTTPHIGGPITTGDDNLTINDVPVALVSHPCSCNAPGKDSIKTGHSGLTVNGIPVAIQGSTTAHGGVILQGDTALTVS